MLKLIASSVMLLAAIGLAACADDDPTAPPATDPPAWARVAPDQIAEAKKHGVPVAFENDIGMRFVLIPAGTFVMGSPENEEGRSENEGQHIVTITRPYYMQVTETTNAQYRSCLRDHDSGDYKGHFLNHDSQPVVQVSWDDATTYATWLSNHDHARAYVLPTEAQWEYACRSGTATRFAFGDDIERLVRYGNFSDKYDPNQPNRQDLDDGHAVSAFVGSYLPNRWGLHDMHGNVWEYCSDRYREHLGSTPAIDPTGPSTGEKRVLRGGTWSLSPTASRSAARDWAIADPAWLRKYVGFRLVSPLPGR